MHYKPKSHILLRTLDLCAFLFHVHHKLLCGLDGPEGSDKQDMDEESENSEKEERQNKDEGDGLLHNSTSAKATSTNGMDRRGNAHSSIKCEQGDMREDCRTAGLWDLR